MDQVNQTSICHSGLNVINLRFTLELSVCYEAVAIAWRSFLDDLIEAKRPRAQLFEQSEFWALSEARFRSS